MGSTMLAFSPGELSTIEGPITFALAPLPQPKKRFNLRDLPCPPQSIMVKVNFVNCGNSANASLVGSELV